MPNQDPNEPPAYTPGEFIMDSDNVPRYASIDWGKDATVSMEVVARFNSAGTLVEFWSVDPMDPETPGYIREAWRRMRGDRLRERERAEIDAEQGVDP